MEAEIAVEALLDRVATLKLAPAYVFDPNPVFWALGPQTLRVTLLSLDSQAGSKIEGDLPTGTASG